MELALGVHVQTSVMIWTLALESLAMTYVESFRQVVVLCHYEVSILVIGRYFWVPNKDIPSLSVLGFLLFDESEGLNPEGAVAEGAQFGWQLIMCDVSPG